MRLEAHVPAPGTLQRLAKAGVLAVQGLLERN